MADGRSNAEIAEALNLSVFTVKNHVSSILMKLQAQSRTEATAIILRGRSADINRLVDTRERCMSDDDRRRESPPRRRSSPTGYGRGRECGTRRHRCPAGGLIRWAALEWFPGFLAGGSMCSCQPGRGGRRSRRSVAVAVRRGRPCWTTRRRHPRFWPIVTSARSRCPRRSPLLHRRRVHAHLGSRRATARTTR